MSWFPFCRSPDTRHHRSLAWFMFTAESVASDLFELPPYCVIATSAEQLGHNIGRAAACIHTTYVLHHERCSRRASGSMSVSVKNHRSKISQVSVDNSLTFFFFFLNFSYPFHTVETYSK
ncbi:hypothetical protein F5Y12DRAFT_199821 [Xylaria sp. FL1777]|nr:hypothetical protein F5Y12DRAFT_199821 [Xylaria sp. FL1777]